MSYLIRLPTLKGHDKSNNQDTDLRAATRMELDLKIFRMNRLEIPQERIAKKLGELGMPICKSVVCLGC